MSDVKNLDINGVKYDIKDVSARDGVANLDGDITGLEIRVKALEDAKDEGYGLQLFDIVPKDHILTFEESKGFAPLGSYIYKTPVLGTRYGYSDFYNRCVSEYQNGTDTYLSSNINVIGSITNNEGVCSGFATGNYLCVPSTFTPVSSTWEIKLKFHTPSSMTVYNDYLGIDDVLAAGINNTTRHFTLAAHVVNNGWEAIVEGTHEVQPNTDYWIKINYSSNNYSLSYSLDGETYNTECYFTLAYQCSGTINIGKYHSTSSSVFQGSINLNESYIKINGQSWWKGTNQFKQSSNGHRYYDIAEKAVYDYMFEQQGEAWYYGVDIDNERIFLPRSTRIKFAGADEVGKYQEAGLPSLEHRHYNGIVDDGSQVWPVLNQWGHEGCANGGANTYTGYTSAQIDVLSPIYGRSTTVQYSSTKLIPYMVVGRSDNEQGATDITEITSATSDTLPLLHHIPADELLNHPSWVRSAGQWNDGRLYTTAYNYLLNEYNTGAAHTDMITAPNGTTYTINYRTVNGKKVVLFSNVAQVNALYEACGSAWYYVINEENTTFRLPVSKNYESYASDASRVGLDVFAGLPNITGSHDGHRDFGINTSGANYTYNSAASCSSTSYDRAIGCGFDASRSNPIYGNSDTVTPAHTEFYLYFKVANAMQNLELIDAGRTLEAVNDLIPNNSSVIANYAMPSDTYIDLVLGEDGATYIAPSDGWYCVNGKDSGVTGTFGCVMRNQTRYFGVAGFNSNSGLSPAWSGYILPAKKGDTIWIWKTGTLTWNSSNFSLRFYYAVGSESEAS